MTDDLDDLTNKLAEGFQVDPDALGNHPRYSQFKNQSKAAEQQAQRRADRLKSLKEGLFDKIAQRRNLRILADYEMGDEDSAKVEDAENVNAIFGNAEQRSKQQRKYADQLLLSEWLVDIPDTLSTDWTMVMAPSGKRCIVVASRGFTTSYNKSGRQLAQFQSRLPGGSARAKNQSFTILDCIYTNNVYYVLDLLSWNSHEYAENPFDFRMFMLQSKLEENPELSQPTNMFKSTFAALPRCPCSKEAMEQLMQTKINFRLDGLLFYHNSVIYEPGQSPLVGWLKPWMLPELLQVQIPQKFDNDSKGRSSAEYIEDFNQKHRHTSQIDRTMEQD